MFDKNINFSAESAKKTAKKNYGLLFLIALYSPKNDHKNFSEMRNYHSCHFTVTKVFLGLGPILMTGLKY